MNKNFSDKNLDQIFEKIVKDLLPNEDAINEIADSPKLRWNVQSRIKQEKASRRTGWIPVLFDRRIAAFASVAFVFCAGLILFVNFGDDNSIAEVKPINSPITETLKVDEKEINPALKIEDAPKAESKLNAAKISATKIVSPKIKPKLNTSAKRQKLENKPKNDAQTLAAAEEIKTDFIALAYSPAPDSGQILKVKVPRSMMVSLGVAVNIENASQLVNAEVVMGDDGLARAIRFVR